MSQSSRGKSEANDRYRGRRKTENNQNSKMIPIFQHKFDEFKNPNFPSNGTIKLSDLKARPHLLKEHEPRQ